MNGDRAQRQLGELQRELHKLGIESISNFVLPGPARHEIDLYMPQLPRGGIEIKHLHSADQLRTAIEATRRLAHLGRRELGSAFVTILLIFHPGDSAPFDVPQLPTGIHAVLVNEDGPDRSGIVDASVKIKTVLDHYRQKLFRGITAGVATMGAMAGILGLGIAPVALAMIAPQLLSRRKTLSRTGAAPARDAAGPTSGQRSLPTPGPSTTAARAIVAQPKGLGPAFQQRPLSAQVPPTALVRDIAIQAEGLALAFRDLVPDAHVIVDNEMRLLVEEFRCGHFTACALRAGRILESMIYALSRAWSVPLSNSAHARIEAVQKSLDHYGELLGDFEAATPGRKNAAKEQLTKAGSALNQLTFTMVLEISGLAASDGPTQGAPGRPQSVRLLLKRIKKRYGHVAGAGIHLRDLLRRQNGRDLPSPIDRIIEVRNQAAHAPAEGKPHEIDQQTVRQLLDDIAFVLQKLSNVAISIGTDDRSS